MNIREYEEKDYDQVNSLSIQYGQNHMPKFGVMGGYGLVLENSGDIEGFVWALISNNSSTALIDYFFVKDDRRDGGIIPALLMSRMLVDLMKKGKDYIVGVIKLGIPHADSIARLYKAMGLDVTPAYLMTGNSKPIIDNLMRHINRGN